LIVINILSGQGLEM